MIKSELAAIPWCARLLGEPGVVVELPFGRKLKAKREDALIAQTLNTKDTIARFITIHARQSRPGSIIQEVRGILTLGGGVNGFPGIAHGGMVATILDEMMGTWININMKYRALERTPGMMTAFLNTTFVKPVKTPGTILSVTRMVRRDGRKVFVDATIEDGEGDVLAKGEGMFIALRQNL